MSAAGRIGNEMYGPWQSGHMSLNQYWVKHNNIVEAMKEVDPKIKVVLGGASICEKSIGGAEKKGNFFPSIWEPPITAKLPYEFGTVWMTGTDGCSPTAPTTSTFSPNIPTHILS